MRGGKREHAGRPPMYEEKKTPISPSITIEAKARLAQLAEESGKSQAAIVNWLILSARKIPKSIK